MTRWQAGDLGRRLEDWGMGAAIAVGCLAALARIGVNSWCSVRPCPAYRPGFPWELWLLMGMLVLPKVLGRATAGRIWLALVTRGRRLTGRHPTPGDGDDA
jgi:hypothetical protein